MKNIRWLSIIWLAGCSLAMRVGADVKLPAVFSDHMVLQQGRLAPVWGWADDGEPITVEFRGQTVSTRCEGGKWKVMLPRLQAGGPDTLVVSGKNRLQIQDVLVGEVWICSGQSNMEWPLQRSFEAPSAVPAATNRLIRLLTVPKLKANMPVPDIQSAWQVCDPAAASSFSAVAFFFGRALQESRQVPVGLIHTSWGGSPAEVWMSHEALAANADYQRDIVDPFPAQLERFQAEVARWEKEKAELDKQGKPMTRARPWNLWKPAELYNGMIAPLIPFAIRGAIWYQGESNAGRAWQYRTLFPDMIRNWRQDWGQGDFAFLAVQLAPWDRNKKRTFEQIAETPVESDWAELREAQDLATRLLPKVGVAVITDVGDKDDIHPTRKQPVGERLALAARGIAHAEKIVWSGPVFQSMSIEGDRITLSFRNIGKGLEARGGPLTGFAICGPDRKFVWAQARIYSNRVIVRSPAVSQPVAVRYGWADYPVVNLWNKDGLPASPFRTDDFPLTTKPKNP